MAAGRLAQLRALCASSAGCASLRGGDIDLDSMLLSRLVARHVQPNPGNLDTLRREYPETVSACAKHVELEPAAVVRDCVRFRHPDEQNAISLEPLAVAVDQVAAIGNQTAGHYLVTYVP